MLSDFMMLLFLVLGVLLCLQDSLKKLVTISFFFGLSFNMVLISILSFKEAYFFIVISIAFFIHLIYFMSKEKREEKENKYLFYFDFLTILLLFYPIFNMFDFSEVPTSKRIFRNNWDLWTSLLAVVSIVFCAHVVGVFRLGRYFNDK